MADTKLKKRSPVKCKLYSVLNLYRYEFGNTFWLYVYLNATVAANANA